MQSFYGVAICQNLGRFHAMKKRIGTVFLHCSGIENCEVRD